MRKVGRLWSLLLLIPIIAAGAFVIWGATPSPPMPEAAAALQSDAQVAVVDRPWLVFQPTDVRPDTGLIFYPGGRVDPRAYAPAAHAIAVEGYTVVIVPMPLNLAVLGAGRAQRVIATYPEIRRWAIGGHSLGGAMAARFAYQNAEAVEGLILWAAYPASSDDLSDRALAVASIYGTLDGLATGDKIQASRPLLPPSTHWVGIEGGNHAQFGWYGAQAGENPATISREEQQRQVVAATIRVLSEIAAGEP